jgi:hypothetical protein
VKLQGTITGIAENFDLSIKELNKGIRSLLKLLGIKNMPVQINVIGSEEYVKKYCNEMNIKDEYTNQAIKIARNIDKLNIITEHTQFSIAATSVLIMAELNSITSMTKKSLKNMFGVSNVTISKAYKKLEKIKHLLIDDEKINKLVEKLNKLNDETQLSEDIKKRMEKFGVVNKEKEEIKLNKSKDQDENKNENENEDQDGDENYKIKIVHKPVKKIKDKIKDKKI